MTWTQAKQIVMSFLALIYVWLIIYVCHISWWSVMTSGHQAMVGYFVNPLAVLHLWYHGGVWCWLLCGFMSAEYQGIESAALQHSWFFPWLASLMYLEIWAPSQYKDCLSCLIFNMGIPTLVRHHLYIETAPGSYSNMKIIFSGI